MMDLQTAAGLPQTIEQTEVLERCQLAKELEDGGRYEEARAALSPWWERIGERPKIDDLPQTTAAEILMRAGSLSGWIGSARQITDSSQFAKDLIGNSIRIFESFGAQQKAAEALFYLSTSYRRDGAYDESKVLLHDCLARIQGLDGEAICDLKALAYINLAILASCEKQPAESVGVLTSAAPIFAALKNHSHLGKYHNELAIGLKNLWAETAKPDYLDRSLIEFEAASFHFREAGHQSFRAAVENNLGHLLLTAGRVHESHQHFDYAARLFHSLKESTCLAQVEENIARAYLVEQRYEEAEKSARASVDRLKEGSERALLIESLVTHGRALIRLDQKMESDMAFGRAMWEAKQLADSKLIKWTALVRLEEGLAYDYIEAGLTYQEVADAIEKGLYRRALFLNEGKVGKAARQLGMIRQTLAWNVKHTHKDLEAERTPPRTRRKSLIKPPRKKRQPKEENKTSAKVILMPNRTPIELLLPPELPVTGEYLAVRMTTDALEDMWIKRDDWVTVMRCANVTEGDLIAAKRNVRPFNYSVGYLQIKNGSQYFLARTKDSALSSSLSEMDSRVEGIIVGYSKQADLTTDANHVQHLRVRPLSFG